MPIEPAQRWTPDRRCPICDGCDRDQRGHGKRCHGFRGTEGYVHCSRDELAGPIPLNPKSLTYAHMLEGNCMCGTVHQRADVRDIGSSRKAEIIATYDYTDEHGELIYQVVRMQPKSFRQRRPAGDGWTWNLEGVEPLLYRLPDVIKAAKAGDTVYIVEGERDVHTLEQHGQVATCNSGGAGKFPAAMAKHLQGADVVIVRDADDPGRDHARDVFRKLRDVAKSIRVYDPAEGKDVTDHFTASRKLAELQLVWPVDRATDPVQWKRNILRSSLTAKMPLTPMSASEMSRAKLAPTWPTGLHGWSADYECMTGVSILAGGPSAGKTFKAIGSSVEAARDGWHVIYLVCEMAAAEFWERVQTYCQGDPPDSWEAVIVSYGVNLEMLIELLVERVDARRTLIVFDSVSSFVDQAESSERGDPHGFALAKKTLMWALVARRDSEGQISFLLLSELNANGGTKFRIADHKADLSVAIQSDKKEPSTKWVHVLKGWRAKTGRVGAFSLNQTNARLERAV